MVSIIKNQILKHLSRFTKNLSADKINLSTFKGEGELSNLELDEIVLTDLLELPSWLRLTSATCNRVGFRIQWTKLKTVPIHLTLDAVVIEVETCDELRSTSCQQGLSSYAGATKYSFIHKVIDGMTISINTVQIKFSSPAFCATVELTRILVESKSPKWDKCDLRLTRLKDNERGQILLFKELEWQNVRIEARSTQDPTLTPLRLLTEHARCRITLKKRISDSFILGCRLVVILDELLWVLTDFQLKAALHFIDSLAGLIQKANEFTRKKKAARKLEVLPEYQAQQDQSARSRDRGSNMKMFDKADVVETCYYFVAETIILHFSDDEGPGRSCHPELNDGGSLQLQLTGFQVDYYPYHLAASDRTYWARYKDSGGPHADWLKQSLNNFKSSLLNLVLPGLRDGSSSPEDAKRIQILGEHILCQFSKLMTSCIVMKINDFTLYQVMSGSKKPKEFIAAQRERRQGTHQQGDKEKYNLPAETIIHAEFTYFYYPGDDPFPLPAPKFYVNIKPVRIYFDVISCLWVNSFAVNLHRSLMEAANQEVAANIMNFDVRIEAIQSRIIFESTIDHPGQKDRPKSLHVLVPRACITNVRGSDLSSRAELEKCIDSFQMGSLFYNTDFPSQPSDFQLVHNKFELHAAGKDNVRPIPCPIKALSIEALTQQFERDLLWTDAKDVWSIKLDPIYLDFFGARSVGREKSVPFMDAFPLTLWVYLKLPTGNEGAQPPATDNLGKYGDIHALAYIPSLISLQINHYQYLFLLRLSEEAQELSTYLALDTNRILKRKKGGSLVVGAVLPQLEVALVMPSQSPGKESSGGDVESVYPDSSSIQDDGVTSSHWQSTNSFINNEKNKNIFMEHSIEIQRDGTEENFAEPFQNPGLPCKTANGNAPKISSSNQIGDTVVYHAKPTRQDSQTFPTLSLQSNFNVGFNSLKKGFSTFKQSVDLALKNSPDDISDTVSEKSNASSDSEMFSLLQADCTGGTVDKITDVIESMFRVGSVPEKTPLPPVEVASEVLEDDNTITSPSERGSFTSYCTRRDLVSVATFKLGKVEFLQQNEGFSTAIKIQVSNISSEDCTSIPWDEFQNKFKARTRGWAEMPLDAGIQPCVQIRYSQNLKPNCGNFKDLVEQERASFVKWFDESAQIKIKAVSLYLNASTLIGLTDMVEDEVLATPLPAEITVENVKIHISEDRPPSNITSPGPVPIDLNVSKLLIKRNTSNVISIEPIVTYNEPASASRRTSKTDRTLLHQLTAENEELRRRLAILERLNAENCKLKKCLEDAEGLRTILSESQRKVSTLLQEKQALIEQFQNQSQERNFQR